jgi:hypothetical protein
MSYEPNKLRKLDQASKIVSHFTYLFILHSLLYFFLGTDAEAP